MPVRYSINTDDNIAEISAYGKITLLEIVREVGRIMATGEYKAGMDGIIDASQCDVEATAAQVQNLVSLMAKYKPLTRNARRAIVASEDLMIGISNMYGSFASDIYADVKLFRSVGEARVWLGLENVTKGTPKEYE